MPIKMQQGGDPTVAQGLQDPNQSILGIFSQMNMTNPEAQRWARDYLQEFQDYDWSSEEELLEQRRDVAEESRQALINAREQVLGTKHDPRDKWLAMAQAFGAPTQTGQFGETLGAVAGSLREPFKQERAFEKDKRDQLLELQGAIGGIDESLLESEFGLRNLRRSQELGLAKEAAKIMGKTATQRPRTVLDSPAIKSLDTKMATRYTDWVTGGQEFMVAKQALLADAIVQLRTTEGLSGQWEGLIPKMAKDIFLPAASNVQEVIETVAQESLKKILGGQFGQREGEMLLERTFNPRLEEDQNADRAQALLTKLQRATDEERRAMQYFEDNGTMAGYEGKTDWSILDFLPDPIMQKVRMPDGEVISVPDHWTKPEVELYHRTGEEPIDPLLEMMEKQGLKEGGRVRRVKRKKRYAQGGTVRGYEKKAARPRNLKFYQAGGAVDEDEDVVSFDELDEPRDTTVEFEDFGEEPAGILELGATIAGGTAAGLAAEELGTRAVEKVRGVERPPRSQQLVGTAMEASGVTPAEAATNTRRSRRGRTPAVLMDESGRVTQKLGERAMIAASEPGDVALDMIEERFASSGDRVGRTVEVGLRTPEFHSTEQRLTDRLYQRAKPLYEQAYKEGEKMPWPKYWDEWMQRPYSQQAIDIASEFMAAEGKMIGKPDATGIAYNTSLEFLDQLKRGFDQLIRTEESGTGPTPRSRIMKQQRSQLMRYLNENAPESYRAARAQYKGDLEVLEALDIGRREFHRLDPEEARLMINDMDWSEMGALRTGVAQRIYDVIYNPSSDVDAARRILGSQNMRRRLQLLFERPADWRVFEAALEREMKMFQSDKGMKGRVDRGRSGRQLGEVLQMDDPLAAMKAAMSRGPISWVIRTLGVGGRRAGGLSEQDANEIVEILTNRNLDELDQFTPQLEYAGEYARTRKRRRGKAAVVGTGIGLGLAGMKAFGEGELEDEEPYDEQDIESIKEALGIEEE